MTRWATFILVLGLLAGLASCAKGPAVQAKLYENAVRQGQAEQAAELLDGDRQQAQWLAEAMAEGYVAQPADDEDWQRAEASARVTRDGQVYLLVKRGDSWKVRCASIGPYHDHSPEMTLLLAVHLIQSGKFDRLKTLLPADLKLGDGPMPESFTTQLQQWAEWMQSQSCQPFRVDGSNAALVYQAEGTRRVVEMIQENGRWRISALW